jgi:hypothetical protein
MTSASEIAATCLSRENGDHCRSPRACRDWGYCRVLNIRAGGMKNVTAEMQREWRRAILKGESHG